MPKIICGHFNFIIRDCWLLCQSCEMGININSAKGQRLLATKSKKVKLTKQQQEIHRQLIDSYKEYCKANGIETNDGN